MQERSAVSPMPAYVVVSLLRAGHPGAHIADVDELLEKHRLSLASTTTTSSTAIKDSVTFEICIYSIA